ncbi:MAG: hypothetical protein R3257_04610 [bacterium]|nr:hypothetical protein [bacterium]
MSDQGSISNLIDQIVSEGLQAEVQDKPAPSITEIPELPQGLTVIADDFEGQAEEEAPKKVTTGLTGSYGSRLWNTTHYFAEKILRKEQS